MISLNLYNKPMTIVLPVLKTWSEVIKRLLYHSAALHIKCRAYDGGLRNDNRECCQLHIRPLHCPPRPGSLPAHFLHSFNNWLPVRFCQLEPLAGDWKTGLRENPCSCCISMARLSKGHITCCWFALRTGRSVPNSLSSTANFNYGYHRF